MRTTTLNLGARSRLLIHKFDPATPAPGGIDTCIRGINKYSDPDEPLAIVGVEGSLSGRTALGKWRTVELYGRRFEFMAVAPLDPGNQVRRLPHSLRIGAGLLRYRRQLPRVEYVQTHRADLGLLASTMLSGRHDYFIHTQESGILGAESDSFWKRAAPVHRSVEKTVVKRAHRVRVFNPTYAEKVKEWNRATMASPTWWDPELIPDRGPRTHRGRNLLWVGRLEQPKVPSLALAALSRLITAEPSAGWNLRMVGAGNLEPELRRIAIETGVADHVEFVGRLKPNEVMEEMGRASILLMTSVAGYEGFPRVLVEGLANGLSAVVTEGADTGSLIVNGVNGYRVSPDASDFAHRISQALALSGTASRQSVEHLSAPSVVRALYEK